MVEPDEWEPCCGSAGTYALGRELPVTRTLQVRGAA